LARVLGEDAGKAEPDEEHVQDAIADARRGLARAEAVEGRA